MAERKILDLAKPILRTWSSESDLESMALLQENAIDWMLDNYVNMIGYWNYQEQRCALELIPRQDPTLGDPMLCSWMKCPFINLYTVSHSFVRNRFENILAYILDAIESGYYIFFYIHQGTLSTRMGPDVHGIFVYGFDKKNQILYVADHYDNGKYALAELGFEEFLKAYELTYWDEEGYYLPKYENDILWENKPIYIAKSRPFKYEFSVEWFKIQLKDYLESTHSLNSAASVTEGPGYKRYYGISSYDLVIYYMDQLACNKENVMKDHRIITIICDHKKLIAMRMEYFREKGLCMIHEEDVEKSRMLYKSSEIILYLFLKFKLTDNIEILEKIKDILWEMKNIEFELLSDINKRLAS